MFPEYQRCDTRMSQCDIRVSHFFEHDKLGNSWI